MPRKSITISEDNDKNIQHIRSMFLRSDLHLDIDYTTATNILLDIGNTTLYKSDSENINVDLSELADKIVKNLKKNKSNQEFWIKTLPQLIKDNKEKAIIT